MKNGGPFFHFFPGVGNRTAPGGCFISEMGDRNASGYFISMEGERKIHLMAIYAWAVVLTKAVCVCVGGPQHTILPDDRCRS